MIELYAITDAGGPPLPEIPALRAVATRELAAVCAPATSEEVTPELLWQHERVVEALMDDRDVLPVRYGTRLADDALVTRILEENYERLVETLDIVRGATELSVRAHTSDGPRVQPDDDPPSTGTAYLRTRARALAPETGARRAIHEPLAAISRAATLRPPRLPGEVLCGAYLLDREGVPGFGDLVAQLQADNPGLSLTCTGPWPPYSFAER